MLHVGRVAAGSAVLLHADSVVGTKNDAAVGAVAMSVWAPRRIRPFWGRCCSGRHECVSAGEEDPAFRSAPVRGRACRR